MPTRHSGIILHRISSIATFKMFLNIYLKVVVVYQYQVINRLVEASEILPPARVYVGHKTHLNSEILMYCAILNESDLVQCQYVPPPHVNSIWPVLYQHYRDYIKGIYTFGLLTIICYPVLIRRVVDFSTPVCAFVIFERTPHW